MSTDFDRIVQEVTALIPKTDIFISDVDSDDPIKKKEAELYADTCRPILKPLVDKLTQEYMSLDLETFVNRSREFLCHMPIKKGMNMYQSHEALNAHQTIIILTFRYGPVWDRLNDPETKKVIENNINSVWKRQSGASK